MQFLVIALVATVLLPRVLGDSIAPVDPRIAIVAGVGPALAVSMAALITAWFAARRLELGEGRAANLLRRRLRLLQWTAVAGQAIAVLAFGWLDWTRQVFGAVPALDEVIALLPPVFAIAACWWAAHPLEMKLRGASTPRPHYVLGEIRNQLALLGAPAMLAIFISELVEAGTTRWFPDRPELAGVVVPVAAIAAIFAVPALMVRVLDTVPLEDAPLRSQLAQVLRDCGVRVRGIRVWRTGGTVFNGAVMGFLPQARYLLLTDAVLEVLPLESLRAIVAHEAGHLKRWHLPWLLVVLVAIIGAASLAAESVAPLAEAALAPDPVDPALLAAFDLPPEPGPPQEAIEFGLIGLVMAVSLVAFGWVSRRFERQADAFAVQYLSAVGETAWSSLRGGPPTAPSEARVTPEAVLSMCRALGRVADLNGVRPTAMSWRHGSIQWRQQSLVAVVSNPILGLPIDREVRRIKAGALLLLAVVSLAELAMARRWAAVGEGAEPDLTTRRVEPISAAHDLGSVASGHARLDHRRTALARDLGGGSAGR